MYINTFFGGNLNLLGEKDYIKKHVSVSANAYIIKHNTPQRYNRSAEYK